MYLFKLISDLVLSSQFHLFLCVFLGKSYQGINEEIIWVSIGMGITIAVLIIIALCYILKEKCAKKREYYITA